MPAWSYSALTAFETCPRKYYHTRVAKDIVEPETQALTWGNAVHKALELRVSENIPLPTGMTQWEPLVSRLTTKGEVFTEKAIALNKDLTPVDWFDRSVWVRGKLDLTIIQDDKCIVLDYKTGQPKSDGSQLQLFAALAMAVYPEVDRVKTGFVWLKTNGLDTTPYTRDDVPNIWSYFAPRVARLEDAYETNTWPEIRSGLCRAWCPCSSCPNNGRYGSPG